MQNCLQLRMAHNKRMNTEPEKLGWLASLVHAYSRPGYPVRYLAKAMRDPKSELEAGIVILDPALLPHGFIFHFQNSGRGSGGNFAWGKYVRGDRSLDLHHGWGLGIIQYNIADLSIDHSAYLKSLGVDNESDLLSTPLESGLDRYHALRSDLENFCSDFVTGPATEWAVAARFDGQRRAERNKRLNAKYVGDDRKRLQARELFQNEDYDEVVAVMDALVHPDLLDQSEQRMLEIARKRSIGR